MAAIGRTLALILATAIGSGSMPAADRAVASLTSTDAALLARPLSTGGYEMVYVTDRRLGF